MIFDIATALAVVGFGIVELAKDLRRGLAQDIGKHIETAAVGHTDNDLRDLMPDSLFDHLFQERNQGLCAFQEKPLLLIRDTPPVGMYVLNMFRMKGARLWGSRLHRACVV